MRKTWGAWMLVGFAFAMVAYIVTTRQIRERALRAERAAFVAAKREESKKERENDVLLRRAELSRWLDGVGEVVRRTDDTRAKEVMEALVLCALCRPLEQGVQFIEAPEHELWVALTPILEEDTKLSPRFQTEGEMYAGASFDPENNILLLQSLGMSSIWRGILLLHELDHVDRFFKERYDWKDPRIFCLQELAVHEDQNRWVTQIGGKAYELIVEAEMKRQREKLAEDGRSIKNAFADAGPYDKAMDAVEGFGPAMSAKERDFRQTQVWLHAIFRLMEELGEPGEMTKQRKASALYVLYDRAGVLPKKTQ